MSGFNWFDFLLILLLLSGMALGYAQGLIRQVIGLLALYVGLVVATQFFVPLTQLVSRVTLNPPNTLTNALSFFSILLLALLILNILGQDAYRQFRFKLFPLFDHLGGMILGVASMWVIITVSISVLTFAINTQGWGNAEGYRLILNNGIDNSRIAQVTATTLPMIVSTLRPWLPTGMPALFEL